MGDELQRRPAASISAASIRSVTVGTSTSASAMADASPPGDSGSSSMLRWGVEQLAHARLDALGQLRVTTTRGFPGHALTLRS